MFLPAARPHFRPVRQPFPSYTPCRPSTRGLPMPGICRTGVSALFRYEASRRWHPISYDSATAKSGRAVLPRYLPNARNGAWPSGYRRHACRRTAQRPAVRLCYFFSFFIKPSSRRLLSLSISLFPVRAAKKFPYSPP